MQSEHNSHRRKQFNEVIHSFTDGNLYKNDSAIVIIGDSLDKLKLIPDHSVSLILTDPPYHSTKKSNVVNDKSFVTNEEFIKWMEEYSIEWKRILRPNGSIFLFCSSVMSAQLEIMMSKRFNILSHVVWTKPNDPGFDGWKGKMKKEALRQWYAHSERIIFAEPAVEGNLKRSWFGHFLRQQRQICGLSGHHLTELTESFGNVNHGGAVSNWETGRNIPSRDQYFKISKALIDTKKIAEMPDYEDVIRPFKVDSRMEFTDVWNFNSVRPYKGKHPAEKPLDLLHHCITTSSFENDIVLDCFAGSGSTAIAALNCNRYSISIEIDLDWYEAIKERLIKYRSADFKNKIYSYDEMKHSSKKKIPLQQEMFTVEI